MPRLGRLGPERVRGIERQRPHRGLAHLAAGMERDAGDVEPEVAAEVHQPQRLAPRAAELAAERPVGLARLDQHADDHPRAGRVLGELVELLLGVGRELLDAHRVGMGDVARPLDRVAEGDAARSDAERQAEIDLAARGGVEVPAKRRHRRHHLGRRIRLHRIVDRRVAEAGLERAVLGPHHVEVEDDGRTVEVARADVGILLRGDGALGRMNVVEFERADPQKRQRVACASPSVPGS